jgi:hypothetical protein
VSDYYYAIKRYKDDDVLITKEQANQVTHELSRGAEFIVLNNQMIAKGDVRGVEETETLIPTQALIGDGSISHKIEPLYNLDGSVNFDWYRKRVSNKMWDKFYSVSPGYHLLNRDDGAVVVGFRIIKQSGQAISREVTLCTKEEVRAIEKSY